MPAVKSDQSADRLTAILLAGGRGQRMGMQNKGLLQFAGRPLVAHVLARLLPQVSRIVISANDDLDAYQRFDLPVIPDRIADYPGPLGGIYSVMQGQASEWFITAPCDTPCLPTDYVQRMLAARNAHSAYVAHDGARQQSGFCLLHGSLLTALEDALQAKQFAVHRFLDSVQAQNVDFSDNAQAFVNINDPSDLLRLRDENCSGRH